MSYGPCDQCGSEKTERGWYLCRDKKTRCADCYWTNIYKEVEEEMKMEFKKWTAEEIETFCENNWIENVEWLKNFVIADTQEVAMEMKSNDLHLVIRPIGDL